MPDKPSETTSAAHQVELATSRLDSLSIPGAVAAQIFSRVSQSQFSPSMLADIIESEPALAARILSLISRHGVNLADESFSLRRWLDKLPAQEVSDAVLSVKIYQDFDQGLDGGGNPPKKGLLLHSLAVGCCAKAIAEIVSFQVNSQAAYYAGLLHDIGKFALEDAMPRSFAHIVEEAKSSGLSTCTVERRHLGCDHAILGKHLAQKWQLPNAVSLAIWLHHSEAAAISEDMPEARIAQVVQLADTVARQCGIGQSGSFDLPGPTEPTAQSLGIGPEQLQEIRRNLSGQVAEKTKVLGLDLPSSAANYFSIVHTAAARFARDNTKLTLENSRLQTASSHFDFTTDFLLSINSAAAPIDVAENFAVRWQKFYQTGMVCLYFVPSAETRNLKAVIVEKLSQSRAAILNVPAQTCPIPKPIQRSFAILDAHEHIDWLFDQLGVDFDLKQSKLVPLLSNGKAVGALIFELYYPADVELFEEKFRTSASVAGAVLGAALARQKQEHFAERFAQLISKPEETTPSGPAPIGSLDALAEMAAGAAHELNNPLSVISGRAQLLAEVKGNDEKKEHLRQIQENAREISKLIDGLMSFAEPTRPRPTHTDVRQMLDEAIQLTNLKTSVEHINVQIEIADDVETVFVDSGQIVSAIANIISNAIESYSSELGPIKITAESAGMGELVKLTIRDLGCGMDIETTRKATQPFFSAKPAGRKRGMGLAYAARFIQLNGGVLNIESEPGAGTTVTVYLPGK